MQESRELVENLLRSRKVDRIPVVDFPWDETLAAWVKQGYPTRKVYKRVDDMRWREDGRRVRIEEKGEEGKYLEPVPPWQHFGYDMAHVGDGLDVYPLMDYSELLFETDEWEVRRDGSGAALKFWKHKAGTPEHVDFLMTSREIWERDYRPHLLCLSPDRVDVKYLRQAMADSGDAGVWQYHGHCFVWELMRWSMGDLTMYESLVLDPAWIHDFNRVYTDFYKRHCTFMFEQVGLPDGVWLYEDLGYKNGLIASPRVLGELVFPYYRELVDFFHSYGLPVVLHSCGSTAEALPLIIEAGFDALNPMERKAKGNDPFVFAEKYGDKIAYIGGLDTRVFETNDRDIIGSEVTKYTEGMKARGARFMFGSDHSISTKVHYDSYSYALDVYREHMLY